MLKPCNRKEHALVRPVVWVGDEPLADGIGPDVLPFGGEVLAAAQLGVPALALPEGMRMGKREREGDFGLPVFHPAVEVGNGNATGNAQQMDVVRHDDVAGNEPVPGIAPGIKHAVHGGWVVEHPLPVLSIDGDEKNDRMAVAPVNGVAGGTFSGMKRSVIDQRHGQKMP